MAIATTEDALLGGRVRLRQPAEGYRAAVDPVLLAAAADPPPNAHVLDLGTGTGAVALCLLARRADVAVTGIERDPGIAELARENAALNGWADRMAVIAGDVVDVAAAAIGRPVDHVTLNPPYLPADHGHPSPHAGRAAADVEDTPDLDGWIAIALSHLPRKRGLSLVHRADRLDEAIAALRAHGAGGISVLPIWPKAGEPARRVIVTARKGVRAPFSLQPGLMLHAPDGSYTAAADAVLRDGGALG